MKRQMQHSVPRGRICSRPIDEIQADFQRHKLILISTSLPDTHIHYVH